MLRRITAEMDRFMPGGRQERGCMGTNANNALYFDDSSDFRSALWQVCAEAIPGQTEIIGKKYMKEDA